MKIGFSSLVCPGWDLQRIVEQAAALGYQGVELRGLRGELHLPLAPELGGRPERVRAVFRESKVELVCLSSSAALGSKSAKETARQQGVVVDYLELASRLGCPFVRIFAGEAESGQSPERALLNAVTALRALAPTAARLGVILLVENGGDFPSSSAMWLLIDAIDHPSVQCCWNQCNAMPALERPTVSIPRLGNKIGLVHVCDGDYDDSGILKGYRLPGEGGVEVGRQIELLRGLIYRGYLVFEWPKLWVESLPNPEAALPKAAEFLKSRLAAKQAILSAYKGDKNAPRFANAASAPAAS